MTGKELAILCEAQVGTGYVWGGLGYTLTDGRIEQLKNIYPKVYTASYIGNIQKWKGKPVFDCVGLIKHFLWGNVGDGLLRKYDPYTDYDANTMFKQCTNTGKIKDMPEKIGLMLHTSGHCGVYIGNGRAVEARGVDYGVVITEVKNRDWKSYGELPNVDYKLEPKKAITFDELKSLLDSMGIQEITI